MPGFKMSIGGPKAGAARKPPVSAISCFGDEGNGEGPGGRASILPSFKQPAAPAAPTGDQDDSLDAFMGGLKAEIKKPAQEKAKAAWEDGLEEDPAASYLEAFEEGTAKTLNDEADGDGEEGSKPEPMDEDEDGNPKPKSIEPLPRVDHSIMDYKPVKTEFYKAHSEIEQMTPDEVAALRKTLRITVTGQACPSPVASFAHLGLPEAIMGCLRKAGYSQPTAIQAQALPAALSGRDVIGIAETGSGKTCAYLIPMVVHSSPQPAVGRDDGPIGLAICPTRELAIQVEKEALKFCKAVGLRCCNLAGGMSKQKQFKDIKAGSEIVVATPGRIIDIIKMKGCTLRRCTFLVLDEADRMLHMGFEHQLRSIVQNVRPSRQTVFFSATFPPKIERISQDLLNNPVRITIGKLGQAAETVTQTVDILESEEARWPWLSKRLEGMLAKGQVLVFAKSKQAAEELAQNMKDLAGMQAEVIHGDKDQTERVRIMDVFRKRRVNIMVATDLASRGLDVPNIRTVVSYDAARDVQTHTHRIGRTGRAGVHGEAFTLVCNDKAGRKTAAMLVESLEQTGQKVSADLVALAMKFPPFLAARARLGLAPPSAEAAADDEEAEMADEGESELGRGGQQPPAAAAAARDRSRSRSRSPPSPPPTP